MISFQKIFVLSVLFTPFFAAAGEFTAEINCFKNVNPISPGVNRYFDGMEDGVAITPSPVQKNTWLFFDDYGAYSLSDSSDYSNLPTEEQSDGSTEISGNGYVVQIGTKSIAVGFEQDRAKGESSRIAMAVFPDSGSKYLVHTTLASMPNAQAHVLFAQALRNEISGVASIYNGYQSASGEDFKTQRANIVAALKTCDGIVGVEKAAVDEMSKMQ
jgi:hypothetical protein